MSEELKQKITSRLKSYYEISQSIDNLPPQNREVARQKKIWITNDDVVSVLGEASLQVVEMQRKTVKEFQKITKKIRKNNKPAVKLLRDQSYYGGKIDGLLWVLAILDGENKKETKK